MTNARTFEGNSAQLINCQMMYGDVFSSQCGVCKYLIFRCGYCGIGQILKFHFVSVEVACTNRVGLNIDEFRVTCDDHVARERIVPVDF